MDNEILGHAWLEYDNFVIDFTLEQKNWKYDKNDYYKLARIEKIIKYDGKEIQELILQCEGKKMVWVDWIIFDKRYEINK